MNKKRTAIALLLGIILVSGFACEINIESTPTPISTPTSTPKPEVIKEWSGSGIKTTEPFTITNKPWQINWSHNPLIVDNQSIGLLQIFVYSTSNDMIIAVAANSPKAESDTSYIYDVGGFYLMINAANTDWNVRVFASPQ